MLSHPNFFCTWALDEHTVSNWASWPVLMVILLPLLQVRGRRTGQWQQYLGSSFQPYIVNNHLGFLFVKDCSPCFVSKDCIGTLETPFVTWYWLGMRELTGNKIQWWQFPHPFTLSSGICCGLAPFLIPISLQADVVFSVVATVAWLVYPGQV